MQQSARKYAGDWKALVRLSAATAVTAAPIAPRWNAVTNGNRVTANARSKLSKRRDLHFDAQSWGEPFWPEEATSDRWYRLWMTGHRNRDMSVAGQLTGGRIKALPTGAG